MTKASNHALPASNVIRSLHKQVILDSTSKPKTSMSELPPFRTDPGFRYLQSPTPDWQFGDGLRTNTPLGKQWKADEEEEFQVFDPAKEEPRDLYKLMTSGITPRPVAFVSTIAKDGTPNLAPFSYFSMCNHNPPMISVSVNNRGKNPKDTARAILDTKEFTVNIISESFVEAANFTSVEAPFEVDEWIGSGLTREPSTIVKPPRVRESGFSLECELYQSVPLAPPATPDEPTSYLIIGLIKLIHVRNAVLDHTKRVVDPSKLRPVARMGDITYSTLGDSFRIPRPQWESVKGDYNVQS
ncbi:hypothetical protein FRC20_003994 [Serendipita sp. 405]|nr:hypothetical protein FRC20_003994 [Serendipita sp. 405]